MHALRQGYECGGGEGGGFDVMVALCCGEPNIAPARGPCIRVRAARVRVCFSFSAADVIWSHALVCVPNKRLRNGHVTVAHHSWLTRCLYSQ